MDLKPLQEEIYKLLCEIDDICKANDIVYYLHCGSVIGAVRHRGIIPWDDDADVMMTPENYEKFKAAFAKSKKPDRELVDLDDCIEAKYTYGQYKNTASAVVFRSMLTHDSPTGIFIDIMILDPVGESERSVKRHTEDLKLFAEIVCDRYVLNRTTNQRRYKWYHFLEKTLGRKQVVRMLSRRLRLRKHETCAGYIHRVGIYPTYWDKKFFQEPEYYRFGPREFPFPTYTHEFLRYTYGDSWMKYPANRGGHGFCYSPDIPFRSLYNDYKDQIDEEEYRRGWAAYKYWRLKAIKWEDRVRVCNSKRMAAIHSLAVAQELSDQTVRELYESGKYSELLNKVRFYVDYQTQTRFVKDSVPIQVSDDVFYTTCMVLILNGDYDVAGKILKVNECIRSEYPSYDKVEQAVEDTRELSIAYYEGGRDWSEIARLTREGLKKYPHHVDFVAARCDVLAHGAEQAVKPAQKARAAKQIRELCAKEMEFHPEHSQLLKRMADARMMLGKKEKAVEAYQKAFRTTNDGMLYQEIQDIAAKNSFTVEEDEPQENDERYQLQVKLAQEKIQTLLQELDQICKKNKIPYFLGGYLAAEAVELGTFAPECCSAYVIMRPSDRKRFLAAVEKAQGENRALESFENNPDYPDFSMRYCDTSTTLFDLKTDGFYRYHSLNVAVYFMRTGATGRCPEWFKKGLLAAVEACAFPRVSYNHTGKKRRAGLLGRIYFALLGKKRGKELAWKLIYHPQSTEWEIKGSIKSYWYKEIPLPAVNFGKRMFCSLNGSTFPIPVNYREFNAPQVARNWNTGKPVGARLLGELIPEMTVPGDQTAQALKQLNQRKRHFKAWGELIRCNRNCAEKSKHTREAWDVALLSLDRFLLWKEFMPQKKKIITLWTAGKYAELELVLQPYLEKIQYYAVRNMPITFDNDILRVTWDVLARKGKGRLVELMLQKMPPHFYKPISLQAATGKEGK